jgi:uncharacterized repeat protein (TIGR03943 family)
MRRETQNILLVLLGGALLKISLTGTFLRYVKPALQPWLIGTGAVMVLLALLAIGRDLLAARRTATPDAAVSTEGHDHDHEHRSRSPWLLLLPVMAIFLISPPALGADTVARAGSQGAAQPKTAQDSAAFAPLPSGDVIPLKLVDFVQRTAWDDSGSLNDRTVRLTGFVVRDQASNDVYVARLVITCCAADAAPVKVKLAGVDLSGYANDQWVEVTGRAQPGSANRANHYVPTMTAQEVRPTPAPADPYEF